MISASREACLSLSLSFSLSLCHCVAREQLAKCSLNWTMKEKRRDEVLFQKYVIEEAADEWTSKREERERRGGQRNLCLQYAPFRAGASNSNDFAISLPIWKSWLLFAPNLVICEAKGFSSLASPFARRSPSSSLPHLHGSRSLLSDKVNFE